MELAALIDAVGHEAAVRAYALGREAVLEIGRLVAESGTDCDFDVMHSLYLAHRRRDAKRLQKETELRNRNGFEAFFLDAAEVSSRFGYDSRGAIENPGAARMDPLRFTRALLSSATRRGARVYARTAAVAYDTTDTGVRLRTDRGVDVTAHRVIFATGYELPDLFPTGLARLHSTFALVTEPDDVVPPALQSHVVWESARPYSYLRATPDGRIMIGGRDAPYKSAALRDRALPGRSRKLAQRLATLHRDKSRATAFTWSGTFAETKDSLPCIGWLPRYPRGLFALGLGGNGITFSAIASQIICDLYRGRSRPHAHIFRPDR